MSAAEQSPERGAIHEPRCNTYCRPGVHHLTSGIGFPHIHQTNLTAECGECTSRPGGEA